MVSALSGFRAYEDETRSRLTVVRGELSRLNLLAREIPDLERRIADLRAHASPAPYRAENSRELTEKLDAARAGRLERKKLRLEEEKLMRVIESERRELASKGVRRISLPVLDNVDIASPCTASWADMDGDADVRFCKGCQKDVYNLSMMSKDEAEAVFSSSRGKGLCVRLYRRDDGTVLTQDCSVGLRRQRFWRRTKSIAAGGLIAAGIGLAALKALGPRVEQPAMGGAVTELPP